MPANARSLLASVASVLLSTVVAGCSGGGGDGEASCSPPCAAARCALGTEGAYVAHLADRCEGGSCVADAGASCGLYACDGAGAACATSCTADAQCVPSAHCDAGVCVADLANGAACDEPSDCAGGHCQNGFCCDAGDCCSVASDCPTYGTTAPICENAATCQGSRGEPACVESSCTAPAGVPDDSACTAATVASECGLYLAVRCSGAPDQAAPECPTSCASDAECDPEAFCDVGGSGTCKADLADGQACGDDPGRCASGHCQNGFCCAGGDCCAVATDCPASYSGPSACTSVATCQGERAAATCVAGACGTEPVPDDSGCTAFDEAADCGPYPAVRCTGAPDQAPPACATSCASDADCDPSAHCGAGLACVADLADGGACTAPSQCAGGRCANGYCCAAGDCCASASDCGGYAAAPTCDDAATCQGHRVDAVCGVDHACASAPATGDDSGCAGLESAACGPYPSAYCTGAVEQPADQAALCASACATDADCDPAAHCDGGACVPDLGLGAPCDGAADCVAGFCVDGVCCASSCDGTCSSCRVPGSEGLCLPVPNGQDPDGECGAVSCAGYYSGWIGDACYAKADVPAAQATCDGNRACRSPAQECAAQPAGSAALTCDPLCQDPALATCTGTTAGTCTNVNPGTQSCGSGACRVTVPLCASGAPSACVPNMAAATPEACNGLDDDCDGAVDENFILASDPQNCGSCGNVCTNDHGSVACSGGVCTPSCAAGYASCDGNAGNGCETLLNGNPACSAAAGLGSISGDTGAASLSRVGTGEAWFFVRVTEDDSSLFTYPYLSATFQLLNPPGVDYDLFTYCASCGGALSASSALGAGQTDVVQYRKNDTIGVDDSAYVFVEVRYFGAASCGQWTLQVFGNTTVGAATCN